MNYYKAIIEYDGTNFAGFQWQKDASTVQSEFNIALALLLAEKFTTMSASRTDSGVHARAQVVKISSENLIDCSSFLDQLNNVLPAQIRLMNISPCHGLFKPSAEAISKEYRYFFTNMPKVSIDDSRFIANISNKLDMELLHKCIQALVGEYDFCNFYSSGSNVKSTIRNILMCELSEINPHLIFSNSELFKMPTKLTHCYELKIEGNGFLKQMIRHIVSALWMVGSGKLNLDDFIKLINGPKSTRQIWKVAPSNGLFLYKINFSQSNNLLEHKSLF